MNTIGIYPEWNVKYIWSEDNADRIVIGIYPEWNVKNKNTSEIIFGGVLEYIQNGM